MSTPISQNRADLVPVIAEKYRDILRDLGEDFNRDGLIDTPLRAAKALLFFTKVISRNFLYNFCRKHITFAKSLCR